MNIGGMGSAGPHASCVGGGELTAAHTTVMVAVWLRPHTVTCESPGTVNASANGRGYVVAVHGWDWFAPSR